MNLLRARPAGTLAGESILDWRSQMRRELGLPDDAALIGTGHQAAVWHPGILAKFMAARAMVDRAGAGASAVHLVVDQDANEFGEIDVPVRDGDGVRAETIAILDGMEDRATGFQPPQIPKKAGNRRLGFEFVESGLDRIQSALSQHAEARSLAAQIAGAVEDMMQPFAGEFRTICASDLLLTAFGSALVRDMRDDPERCALAYNRAVQRHADAGIALLEMRGTAIELPLWRIDARGRRARVFVDDLEDDALDAREIHPRALTMTAVVRLAIFDLFVHGTGGRAYDRVMEQWMRDWLKLECAPMAVATANVFLPIAVPAESEPVEQAIHTYRHVWHDPAAGEGGAHPSASKQAHLKAIEAMRNEDARARREAFVEMHRVLASERSRCASALNRLARRIDHARCAARSRAVASRRDWGFPLYPDSVLRELRSAIERKFDALPITHRRAHSSAVDRA